MHDDDHPLARAYHQLLVWDIMKRPAATRVAERALNPLIGKSLVRLRPQARPGGGTGRRRRPQRPARGRRATGRSASRLEGAHAGA